MGNFWKHEKADRMGWMSLFGRVNPAFNRGRVCHRAVEGFLLRVGFPFARHHSVSVKACAKAQ
jgi:hypothetical protein